MSDTRYRNTPFGTWKYGQILSFVETITWTCRTVEIFAPGPELPLERTTINVL